MAVTINASTSAGAVTTADTSGVLQLQTGGTTALTVDASQNVGIGTSSPLAKTTIAATNTATSTRGNLYVYTTDTATANYGGMLSLGGSYSGTSQVPFANIAGRWDGSGINGYMQFSTIASGTVYERARIDASGNWYMNSGYGSVAVAYGCRAWVNFNGTGTVAINASGNVSSITDNGTGDYSVNFTTGLPDANYAVCATARNGAVSNSLIAAAEASQNSAAFAKIFITDIAGNLVDARGVSVSIHR